MYRAISEGVGVNTQKKLQMMVAKTVEQETFALPNESLGSLCKHFKGVSLA